jgi:hypothetical protein
LESDYQLEISYEAVTGSDRGREVCHGKEMQSIRVPSYDLSCMYTVKSF